MGADATSAFLIGRLAQEGRTPQVVLRAATRGPWRGVAGVHVFAVAGDRLWLAQPRLLGEPAIASVPLAEVGEARVAGGGRLELLLGGRPRSFTALDGGDAARAFVEALRAGRP